MKEKVAIYCRLSEEDKNKQNATDDSGSIQNQKAMLSDYSNRMGWEIYGIYSDDDYAGSDRNRPEFKRLLADAQARKFNIVLCKTQSRFTRELELVEKYIHSLFPQWGIRFVSIVDNADTANKGNKKSRQINGLVNEWYLEDMSDSIKSALDSRRKNGFHIGSFALYGYKKDPDVKGHLIIDKEAAAIVDEVFEMYSKGYGKTAIARMLNERGIPNPTEYKRLKGLRYTAPKGKNGTLWKYSAISSMLTNEIYIGNMVQGKYGSISYKSKINKPRPKEEWYVVEGTHDPIIDRELWDRVQKMIAERAKPFANGTIGLFARKTYCHCCGYVMRSNKTKTGRYLKCSNKHVAKDVCEGSFISVKKLERMVIDELNRLSAEYLDKDELEKKIELDADLIAKKKQINDEIAIYSAKVNALAKGIKDLYLDKINGVVSEAEYIEFSDDFRAQKSKLETLVSNLEKQICEIDERIATGDNRRELIEQYVNVEHLTREMVEILIDKIVVGKRIPGTRDVPIEIYWNF